MVDVRKALLQSGEEWAARNRILAGSLEGLIASHLQRRTSEALDLGCQSGQLIDLFSPRLDLRWHGIDPSIGKPVYSPKGAEMTHGWGHEIPFDDGAFDCVVLANVYEHVDPAYRQRTLDEIRRVLAPSGILVGQLPNPHFPIESHSRLPFMGWLSMPAQKAYWRVSPVPWKHDFHVVTIRDIERRAGRAGFQRELVRNFSYPLEAIPHRVRPIARMLELPMKLVPWAWQFVFRRSDGRG
jgi:Methylase involved in ubiquinone/menaquinone biosynthesis